MNRPHQDGRAIRTASSSASRTRGRDAPNVVPAHYEDLPADLEGQMCAAADRIEPFGDVKDKAPFFRSDVSGSGAELLTTAELAGCHARVAKVPELDVLALLHRSA